MLGARSARMAALMRKPWTVRRARDPALLLFNVAAPGRRNNFYTQLAAGAAQNCRN